MGLLQRLGLSLATSIFSLFLIVFAAFASVYMVLDKPPVVKQAVKDSGIYEVFLDHTLTQQRALAGNLPVDNPQVRQAVAAAFPVSYLQSTAEHNIDTTYDWVHGKRPQPDYSVDVSQPKNAFADNVATLVEQKAGSLPACTRPVMPPTTPAELLNMACRPAGLSAGQLAAAARTQAVQNTDFDRLASSITTPTDQQGRPLTDNLSFVPVGYRYYLMTLWIIPVVLLLCAAAIFFWSSTRNTGLKRLSRILFVTGIMSIILSIVAVWLLGKGVNFLGSQNNALLAVQGKLLTIADLLAAQLRTWLLGIGGAYILAGVGLFIIFKIRSRQALQRAKQLNSSLGYNPDMPSVGTTYNPGEQGSTAPDQSSPPSANPDGPQGRDGSKPNQ